MARSGLFTFSWEGEDVNRGRLCTFRKKITVVGWVD